MKRGIIYGMGRPHMESNFEIFLKFVLQLVYKTAKAMSSAIKRIFPPGFDNKTIIKE